MISLQTASWLSVLVCNSSSSPALRFIALIHNRFLQTNSIYRKQLPTWYFIHPKTHVAIAEQGSYSSFFQFSIIELRLLFMTSFCLVEMRLPQFADVTAIAPAPRRPLRGQRHYRGRWSASRSRHRFITLYRKQSQSCFCLSSSRHGVWSLQGAGHAAEELLADKSTDMPTHTHTHS